MGISIEVKKKKINKFTIPIFETEENPFSFALLKCFTWVFILFFFFTSVGLRCWFSSFFFKSISFYRVSKHLLMSKVMFSEGIDFRGFLIRFKKGEGEKRDRQYDGDDFGSRCKWVILVVMRKTRAPHLLIDDFPASQFDFPSILIIRHLHC